MDNFNKEPENFFNKSTVTGFLGESESKLQDSLCVDYDGRTYIRIMKLFKQNSKTTFRYPPTVNPLLQKELIKDFHLRCYLPKDKIAMIGGKINKVVVMINGMNELDHFHLYDLLGEFFANNNMAAILLPTPLHLNRRVDFKDNGPKWPTSRAADNPELFYTNYIQTYRELSYLIDKIKGNEKADDRENDFGFYDEYFAGNSTEIILFGYSLGGVKSLGYFMKDFLPVPINDKDENDYDYEYIENTYLKKIMPNQKINCCITLNSGPNLSEAHVNAITPIPQHEWKNLIYDAIRALEKDKSRLINEEGIEESLLTCFQFLYHDQSHLAKEIKDDGLRRIKGITENYLAILSGKDQIVDGLKVMQQIESDTAFNQFIVAKADHFPTREKSKWHEMLPMVERSTLDFINSCSIKLYQRKMLEAKIKRILEKADLLNYVSKECKVVFHRNHFNYLLNSMDTNSREIFRKYYFRSKAFYATFQEVIRKIT